MDMHSLLYIIVLPLCRPLSAIQFLLSLITDTYGLVYQHVLKKIGLISQSTYFTIMHSQLLNPTRSDEALKGLSGTSATCWKTVISLSYWTLFLN